MIALLLRLLFPWAPVWLVNVASGFVPGFAEGWAAERAKRKADVDTGAQQQQAAQQEADDEATKQAEQTKRQIDAMDDNGFHSALNEWLRPPGSSGR